MARRVYFGFDYEDVKTFRVNVVRNHDLLKREAEGVDFLTLPFGRTRSCMAPRP